MSQKMELPGAYIGVIEETTVGLTKNGFPQWVARLKATKRWVETQEDLEFFHKQGIIPDAVTPAWADWTAYDEGITAFLVLFKSPTEFVTEGPNRTTCLNYDQLKAATGWDGQNFDSLSDETLVGKEILFRVEPNVYEGKTTNKVSWIDAPDASPVRELQKANPNLLASLNARLQVAKPKAKPVSAASLAQPKAAVAKPSPAPAPTAKPTPAAAPATAPTPKAKARPAAKPAPAPTPAPETADETEGTEGGTPSLPAALTKEAAWAWIYDRKGDQDDDTIAEAWQAAVLEVSNGRQEDAMTPADWSRVAGVVRDDCVLI